MAYKYYNANPLNRDIQDCTIRAISVAEGKTWDKTYEELSDIAESEGILLDDVDFIEEYLDDRYDRVPHYAKTVGEFIKEYPYGIYLITMNGHITVVIDSILYDTFDCRDRIMRSAWEVIR